MHANGGWVDKLQVTFTSGWVRKDIKDELIVQLWYYQSDGFEYSGTGSNLDLKQGKCAALVSLSYNVVAGRLRRSMACHNRVCADYCREYLP